MDEIVKQQTLVYLCMGMDEAVRQLSERSYECAAHCPGGMIETTIWAQTDLVPVLMDLASHAGVEMGGTPWFYELCESVGFSIITTAVESEMWPEALTIESLIEDALADHRRQQTRDWRPSFT